MSPFIRKEKRMKKEKPIGLHVTKIPAEVKIKCTKCGSSLTSIAPQPFHLYLDSDDSVSVDDAKFRILCYCCRED